MEKIGKIWRRKTVDGLECEQKDFVIGAALDKDPVELLKTGVMCSGRDVLLQDGSRCGVCEQIQTDPVSITCGHSFCRQCIRSLWDQSVHSGDLTCPCCRKRFKTGSVQFPQTEESMELDEYKPVDDIVLSVSERNKISLKNKYESLFEGFKTQENKILLNRVYTQLYIIEGEREGVNEEHEVLQIENKPWKQNLPDTPINCLDIFNPVQCTMGEMEEDDTRAVMDEDVRREEGEEDKDPQVEKLKSVLTKGIAGIGKTVSVQKFILDWAEGKANQDIEFMFVLPFRELNLIKDKQYSLHGLLCALHPELRGLDTKEYDVCKTVFIFDGLDESRIPLKFSKCEKVSDVTKKSSVDVLMTNLIKGDLLPSAHIWITSRPAAANQIPSQYISRVTEIQGFNDPQMEEYFRKRISDQHQADSFISHIKTTRSLHIMCHIPVFCWISATVLQRIMEQGTTEIPKTLTAMYTHFLCTQEIMRKEKYEEEDESGTLQELLRSNRNMFLKLSKLAFKQLMKGNVMFYEDDLRECGINVTEASVYSEICTEIFREESVLYQRKVYYFVHLSFQEFLAAFYVFHCYESNNMKQLKLLKPKNMKWSDKLSLDELLKGAVRTALKSKTGHLDLFLRFLLGISLESNQQLLQDLLTHTVSSSESIEETIQFIKRILQSQDLPSDRSINLFLCLNEMNHSSLSSKFQEYLKSEKHSDKKLSTGECLALAYMLVNSNEVLDELDLRKYNTSDRGYCRLIPAVSNCRKAILHCYKLFMNSCETLCFVLKSPNSPLKELEFGETELPDAGVKLISEALKSSNCKLETFRLTECKLGERSCEYLGSVLLVNSSLKELDLSNNDLQDSGVEKLSVGLKSSVCKLETLRLTECKLGERSCEDLGSVLLVNSSLKELDLSNNDLQDSGVEKLSAGLKSSVCKLETLRLTGCKLEEKSCEDLGSVLLVNSPLKELDLSNNDLQDSGVEKLSAALKSSLCKLETLRLSFCLVTEEGCAFLASALSSNPSYLKELDLSYNHPGDAGVKLLSVKLEDPHCRLDTLRLTMCKLSEEFCGALWSVLQSENSLKELNLSYNDMQDAGLEKVFAGLKSEQCEVETLKLAGNNLSEKLIKMLSEALQSASCLKELNLSYSDLQGSRLLLLSGGLKRLEIVRLAVCNLGEQTCINLKSVLQLKNSSLKELDLSNNDLQDSGVEKLCEELESPHCKLETLRLSGCMITEEGCSSLYTALNLNLFPLKELDLSYNHLGATGVKLLFEKKKDSGCRLDTLSVEHAGKIRIDPSPKKYACELTLDPNTAHPLLSLSKGNTKVKRVVKVQSYPDHPERFNQWKQVLCRQSLTGRCYWETEWSGKVYISVAYKSIKRKAGSDDSRFGENEKSWSLKCSDNRYSVSHNKKNTVICLPSSSSNRVGVYVDCLAGTVSFYRVSTDTHTLRHLHTFTTTFTEPLCAGFWVSKVSSVRLC
ncbi:NLR family CARD domain-containing protein 3-like [Hoplias malabaricus]|uniref:NLR family CARD domain-containing protein 3-like n=1 Tax=Hoplias malabaricus TaxID=27720 RepID=UPI003462F74D